MLASILRRLRVLLGREQLSQDLDEEIRGHVDALREDLEAEGHSPAEAARLARVRLGGSVQTREASSDAWRFVRLEDWARDVRLACRALARRPGFAVAAIATLALGIGASTAIFSVAYGVSVRPLPYPDPDRLVRLYEANPGNGQLRHEVSIPAFHHWCTEAPSIQSAALFGRLRTRHLADDVTTFTTMAVSPSFFRVLGVTPALGPGFRDESEYTRFTAAELVLSHGAWQRHFGGRSDVIGKALRWTTDDTPFVIVGVTPEWFRFEEADGWMPGLLVELPLPRMLRDWRYDRVVARLRPDATVEGVRAELESVAARLAAEYPSNHGGWTVTVETLRESIIGRFAGATWLLIGAVAVVLVVACLNVGGLFVTRAMGRDRETAVRLALGAGRWSLARLWFIEAFAVAVSGAAAGVGLAAFGVAVLRAVAPPGIPRLEDVRLDGPVLAVALAAGVLAAVVFALAPLGRAAASRDSGRLRSGTPGAGDAPSRTFARSFVLAAQCAGAATLVVFAVVLADSFRELMRIDPGWSSRGLLSLTPDPPTPEHVDRPWHWYVLWSDDVIRRLEDTPEIARAAMTTQVPLGSDQFVSTLARGREDDRTATNWPAVQHNVTDGYFDTVGLRLVEGRVFGADDRFTESQLVTPGDESPGVAIVSESVARELWPGRSAIGQSIRLPDFDDAAWRDVVGLVEDMQFYTIGEQPALHVFVPWTQAPTGRPRLVVRAEGNAADVVPVVRGVLQSVVSGTTVDRLVLQDDLVRRATAQPRFTSALMATFAGLALGLAAVGIYGTLAFVVASRRRELGIRTALGARPWQAMTHVMALGLVPVVAGVVAGLGLAAGVVGLFRSAVEGLSPISPLAAAAASAVVLAVSVAAALGPARRAASIDPLAELRGD